MTIPNPQSRRTAARRLDRAAHQLELARREAVAVVSEMRRGEALHLHHGPRSSWALSTGRTVQSVVALLVINDPHIVGAGDTLFVGALSQTFRYTEEGDSDV
jgi:hypothetical protein